MPLLNSIEGGGGAIIYQILDTLKIKYQIFDPQKIKYQISHPLNNQSEFTVK